MTTAIFARIGYFVAQDERSNLREGDEFNLEGYFESSDLIENNVRVLGRAGFVHHNTWKFEPITDEQVARISNLEHLAEDAKFVEQFNRNSPWVWKDPRLCYTLAYWWPMLRATNTVVLLVHRSHRDIHLSFQRIGWRDGTSGDRKDVKERTEHHVHAAKKIIERNAIPFCEFQYEDFKQDPESVLKKINTLAELELSIDDLGFRPEFDHSSGRGAIERKLESAVLMLPNSLVRFAKRLVPKKMLNLLFPSRFG